MQYHTHTHTPPYDMVSQVMGDELKQILESQRHLESEFEGMGLDGGRLRDHAHSLNATAQGKSCPPNVCNIIIVVCV